MKIVKISWLRIIGLKAWKDHAIRDNGSCLIGILLPGIGFIKTIIIGSDNKLHLIKVEGELSCHHRDI